MPNTIDKIQTAGKNLLKRLSPVLHVDLGFNKQTVILLDVYIDGNRDTFSEEEKKDLSYSIGYILGETIIKDYGGEWIYSDDFHQWAVKIEYGVTNPIEKTWKYLNDYLDSIESYYNVIGMAKKNGGFKFRK